MTASYPRNQHILTVEAYINAVYWAGIFWGSHTYLQKPNEKPPWRSVQPHWTRPRSLVSISQQLQRVHSFKVSQKHANKLGKKKTHRHLRRKQSGTKKKGIPWQISSRVQEEILGPVNTFLMLQNIMAFWWYSRVTCYQQIPRLSLCHFC